VNQGGGVGEEPLSNEELSELQRRQLDGFRDQDMQLPVSELVPQEPASNPETTVGFLSEIITPTQHAESSYDKLLATRDYSLTYITKPAQIELISAYDKLIDALKHMGLDDVAFMFNAEKKAYLALLRAQNFAQQRELRMTRHEIKRESEKKGLW